LDGGLIVSEALARTVLTGGPALGRRVRFVGPLGQADQRVTGPWREIVGVVEDLYVNPFDRQRNRSIVYHAVAPTQLQAATLLVRVRGGNADAFIPRLQEITANRDPDFRLGRISNLAATPNSRYLAAVVTGLALALLTVLLLSAVGIHALMSLTVTRRRKEIGIRIALGANRGQLLASIFSRAALQLGLGGFVGSLLGGALLRLTGDPGPEAVTFLAGVVVSMLAAGLLAAAAPARRGICIQPMEALRVDD
jgi:predicted lysophospholipase L1 biosynthesis ABC-type transport system permease subunit